MSIQTAALYLETKNLMGAGLKSASNSVKSFASGTKSAAASAHNSISGLGDKVTALGRANASFMIGLGAIGAVGFGIKKTFDLINAGLQPAQELQTAMSRVKAVMSSMTDKAMIPQLRKQALALSGSGDLAFFTAVQVASGQRMLIKSGMDAKTTMKSVAATLAIAGAEQIDLATAADLTTNIMSGFGLQARQSADAANMLAEASRTSNTDIMELSEGAKVGAAAFKLAGGSLGEFLALGGTLAGFGIKGSDFGTGIKSLGVSLAKLGELSAKGDRLRDLLKVERSDIVNAQGNIDAIKALSVIGKAAGLDRIKIEDKYGKQTEASAKKAVMGNAQVTSVLAKIFKQYQFGKIAILAQEAALGKVQTRVEKYNKQIGLGQGGAAYQVMREQIDNVEGSVTLLNSAWTTLLVNLGNPFLSAKRGFIDTLTAMLNMTNALVTNGEIAPGITAAEAMGAQFGEVTKTAQFGEVTKTPIKTEPVPMTPGQTGGGKSETNIILTGNNEFYNESLEQEVFGLALVGF